jgi:hypothetical protein
MPEKKPYIPPQIFRVELNQEQAILATCSNTVASASNNGTRRCRTAAPQCRRSGTTSGTSGSPPS